MDTLGELQHAFFDALYTFRIPIAVGSMVGAFVVLTFAWRVGWFAAARRHPGRSGVLLLVVMAVAVPLTYYLASPLWVRTELVEPDALAANLPGGVSAPAASPDLIASGPASTASAATAAPSIAERTSLEARTVSMGSFHGTDEFHFGRGTARIVETATGSYTLRLTDFSVRNGPDLFVYLSPDRDGHVAGALELGRLKATDGSFGYALPPGTDAATFASAIIWCKQFSHLFAVAPLATT